jgi:CheY-like chemotaxis protein
MTVSDFVQVLDAVTRLIAVLVWPVLILLALRWGSPFLTRFFENLGEMSIRGAGVEASFKKTQIEVATNLAAAAAAAPSTGEATSAGAAAEDAAEVVADSLTKYSARRARRARILWVDDNPNNNAALRRSFEALGVEVVIALSTAQALDLLESTRFNVVISDMGRPPDEKAGYTLLSAMQRKGAKVPFLIYAAGGNIPAHRKEAAEKGAAGSTNKPTELFSMAMELLRAG